MFHHHRGKRSCGAVPQRQAYRGHLVATTHRGSDVFKDGTGKSLLLAPGGTFVFWCDPAHQPDRAQKPATPLAWQRWGAAKVGLRARRVDVSRPQSSPRSWTREGYCEPQRRARQLEDPRASRASAVSFGLAEHEGAGGFGLIADRRWCSPAIGTGNRVKSAAANVVNYAADRGPPTSSHAAIVLGCRIEMVWLGG